MLHHTENQPNYSTNINKHLSTLPRLANCQHLSKRRRRKKKLRKEFASKKYGATSHKQVASRYFRQPSAGNSSDAWNNELASVLEALSSKRFQPFNRDKGLTSTGYIIATETGSACFFDGGTWPLDRREFQVWKREEIRSWIIRVVYEVRVTILFISLLSTRPENSSWSRSNLSRGISTKGYLSRG